MNSKIKSPKKLSLLFAPIILLIASAFAPVFAWAEEVTWTADWTVKISLQGSPANIPEPVSPTVIKAFGIPVTGDSLFLLMVGVLALVAAAFFVLCVTFKFAGNTGTHSAVVQTAGTKRRMTFLAIAAVIVAALSLSLFGMNASNARADENQSYFTGNSIVKVDEQGKVLSNSITFTNNSGSTATVVEAHAIDELQDWKVQLTETTLKAVEQTFGTWVAEKLPADVLSQLKKNGGELVLTGKAMVQCDVEESQYSVKHYTENLDGTYAQDPIAIVMGYGVEGQTTKAETIELEGYTPQAFEQATINSDGTTEIDIYYNLNSYKVEFDGNGHDIDTPEQSVKYGGTVTKPADPKAGALTFDGWFTDAACTVSYDFENATMPAKDVKLYAKWSLTPIDFAKATVDTTDKIYTSQEIKPAASIDGLTEGTDYTVTYSDNVKAGAASIKLTGIGDYKGEKTFSFSILPAEVKVSGIKAISKDYNGTTLAQLDCSNAVIAGLLGADKVTVTAKGTFENPDVGENKKVFISDIALEGDDAANYKLSAEGQQTESTAMIVGNYRIFYNNVGDGINLNPEAYSSTDESFNLVDAVWEGYDFDGWYDKDGKEDGNWGNKVTTIAKGTNSDLTLYAKWTGHVFTVTYWDQRTENKTYTQEVRAGEKLTAPNINEKDQIVTGWYVGSTITEPDAAQWNFESDTMPARDLDLFSKWHAAKCTVVFADEIEGGAYFRQEVDYGATAALPSFPAGLPKVINGTVFNYWYYDKEGTDKFDTNRPVYDDITVYGKRCSYGYWLAYKCDSWPMKYLVKSPDQLKADIKVLKDENHSEYTEEEYNKVKEEYTKYMNDDNVYLYTYYGGEYFNMSDLLSFRIIEVGRHDRGDGTLGEGVLTFQSTCSVTTAYSPSNGQDIKNYIWTDSYLRQLMSEGGKIYNSIDSRLMDDIAVTQTATYNPTEGKLQYNDDKLFLLSFTEVFAGKNIGNVPVEEGTQYAYFKIDANRAASKLKLIGETYSGGDPEGSRQPYDDSQYMLDRTWWWMRSLTQAWDSRWALVDDGLPYEIGYYVKNKCGVPLAFSM